MSDPIVTLRLTGTGPAERVRAWVEALGRVPSARRVLELDAAPHHPDLPAWCREAQVDLHRGESRPSGLDVLVVGAARDLPAPGALHRLVAATTADADAHETRVLPHGATAAGGDVEPTGAPVVCVAVPRRLAEHLRHASSPAEAAEAARASGVDVRQFAGAAVFTDLGLGPSADAARAAVGSQPPYGHPAALPSTSLHQVLVRTGLTPPHLPAEREDRPLLTVLTRTQGTRLLLLEENLTCLAGQSSRDFELVLSCHRLTPDALASVRALVDTMPAWLREQTTVLEVERPGRSAPLNAALDVARGRYAVVLDDDDTVTAGWVAAFAEAEARGPGTALRSVALAQDVRPVAIDAALGPAPDEVGPARPVWPNEFGLVEHLWDNASPPMTFAIPRGVFDDLGLRFDEDLDTTEDWDFLLRTAALTGVTSTSAVTAVYRVWTLGEGSRHLHDTAHWAADRDAVLRSIDEQVVLLPPGAARAIRDLRRSLLDERAEKFRFAGLNEQAARDLVSVNEAVVALRARIADLEERLQRQRRRNRGG
jgi:hypothetical protein